MFDLFLTVAIEQAEAQGFAPDDGEALRLLDEAHECATAVTYAFTAPTHQETDMGRVQQAFRMRWSAIPGNIIHDARTMGTRKCRLPISRTGSDATCVPASAIPASTGCSCTRSATPNSPVSCDYFLALDGEGRSPLRARAGNPTLVVTQFRWP